MIRLKLTLLLVFMAFAGACATADTPQAQVAAPPTTMTPHGCKVPINGLVPINITYIKGSAGNPGTISVNPPHAGENPTAPPPVARVGGVLQFNLVFPAHTNADDVHVSISGKMPTDGWLVGDGTKKIGNAASQKFYICIPKDLVEPGTEKTFGYNVDAYKNPTDTYNQLDPLVTVRNP